MPGYQENRLACQCPDVVFYRCMECGALFPVTGGKELEKKEISCCGKKASRLEPTDAQKVSSQIQVTYQITGGYNDNAVRVSWNVPPRRSIRIGFI